MSTGDDGTRLGGGIFGAARRLVSASARRARGDERLRYGVSGRGYAELKREVVARGLLARQPGYYAVKIAATLALCAAAVAWVAATRASALVWLGAPLAAFAAGQLVLLGHDAAHRAVFASRRANDALALVVINLLNGGSHGWWCASHNEHHARSNLGALDPDIEYPFLAFSEEHALTKDPGFRAVLARQHWLAPLLMAFVGLNMRAYGLAWLARRPRRVGEILATATYAVAYPALIVSGLGLGRGALFILLHQALWGVYLGSATSPNHWGMPMPRDLGSLDFVRHQVTTSRNIAGGHLADTYYGGLNFQVEHHLFPGMPRNNLRRVAPLVRAFCAARGIAYHEVSALAAYRDMYRVLRRVARFVRGLDGGAVAVGGARSGAPLGAEPARSPVADPAGQGYESGA